MVFWPVVPHTHTHTHKYTGLILEDYSLICAIIKIANSPFFVPNVQSKTVIGK